MSEWVKVFHPFATAAVLIAAAFGVVTFEVLAPVGVRALTWGAVAGLAVIGVGFWDFCRRLRKGGDL